MKLKRFCTALLAVIMTLTMLASCGATDATEEFFKLQGALAAVKTGTFHEEISITVPKELSQNVVLAAIGLPIEDLEDDIEIDATLDMICNVRDKEAKIVIDGAYGKMGSMRITTAYLKGETIYINLIELMDFLINGMEMGDMLGAPEDGWEDIIMEKTDGNEYISVDLISKKTGFMEDFDLWETVESANQSDLSSIFMDALKASAQEHNLVEATKNREAKYYTFNINQDNFSAAASSMLDYMREHEDEYTDAVNKMLKGLDAEIIPEKTQLTEKDWDKAKELLEECDIPDFSFSYGLRYDKKEKNYSHVFSLSIPEGVTIETAGTAEDKVDLIRIPDAYDADNVVLGSYTQSRWDNDGNEIILTPAEPLPGSNGIQKFP